MAFEKELFDIEFTEECIEEITRIYDYIVNDLKERDIAKRFITKLMDRTLNLVNMPELYMKIGKVDKLKREYHRMVLKKYVILYTIDNKKRKIYVSHVIFGRKNYLN